EPSLRLILAGSRLPAWQRDLPSCAPKKVLVSCTHHGDRTLYVLAITATQHGVENPPTSCNVISTVADCSSATDYIPTMSAPASTPAAPAPGSAGPSGGSGSAGPSGGSGSSGG